MNKRQLKKALRDARWHKSADAGLQDVYDAVQDYERSTGDYSLEEVFSDFADTETAEQMAVDLIENDGLYAVRNFIGDVSLGYSWYRISPYGYLENIDSGDVKSVIENITDILDGAKVSN